MNHANNDADALVHLRVPAALKAAWVRDSRAAGQRLTDWIIRRVQVEHAAERVRAADADGVLSACAADLAAAGLWVRFTPFHSTGTHAVTLEVVPRLEAPEFAFGCSMPMNSVYLQIRAGGQDGRIACLMVGRSGVLRKAFVEPEALTRELVEGWLDEFLGLGRDAG